MLAYSRSHRTGIVAEYGRSTALEGLKQAVNDTVEHLNDKSAEFVQCMDEKLREQGIVTFSEVRRRYSSSFKRILKRGNLSCFKKPSGT
jgi:2-polyprenyl-3-methyl-5-hydroxy-6-metoxy-1,4-benzoquinol methylase